jgi:hypothetical protein
MRKHLQEQMKMKGNLQEHSYWQLKAEAQAKGALRRTFDTFAAMLVVLYVLAFLLGSVL